jgi:IS1 family transposase
VALDPEHRLVLSVVPGRRTAESVKAVVTDTQRRTGGRMMRLVTTDEYPAYEAALLDAYGVTVTPPRTGKPGRPKAPYKVPAPGLRYATVVKTRQKGRVVKVEFRAVFGSDISVRAALMTSPVSRAINTAFVERQNGTDRHRNARKGRRTYRFSKDWQFHEAATYFTLYSYNFCWPVRTLRAKDDRGQWRERTPAMSAGLTDHVWSMSEWLTLPAVQ